jgi:hypothetical protein
MHTKLGIFQRHCHTIKEHFYIHHLRNNILNISISKIILWLLSFVFQIKLQTSEVVYFTLLAPRETCLGVPPSLTPTIM